MWFSLAVFLLAAPDSAEALLQRMEQPILKAKTLQTDVEVAIEPGKDSLKGRLAVSSGNKMRLSLEGTVRGKANKITMVSDGRKVRSVSDEKPGQDQDAPKQLSDAGLGSMARAGAFAFLFLVRERKSEEKPSEFELEKDLGVSDAKLGKKEMVSGREAQRVDYTLTARGSKNPLEASVWIDVKTNLPVKRMVVGREDKDTLTITETYTNFTLDEKIADKEFVLPN